MIFLFRVYLCPDCDACDSPLPYDARDVREIYFYSDVQSFWMVKEDYAIKLID